MFDFSGKTVVITGAAGALGQATSKAFAATGATLALLDRDTDHIEKVFEGVLDKDKHLYLAIDLIKSEQVQQSIETILQKLGKIDILINVAGGFIMGPPLHETDLDSWEYMMNLNARSVFLMARAVVPHMISQQQGKIVNVAARAALVGKAKMAPYVVSKSAVIRLTESLSAELKNQQINVNCILPGTIDTSVNRKDMPDADHDTWVAPEALADSILFLASDSARAVHGAALPVYGLS